MNSTLSGLQEEDWLNNEWIPMVTNDASEPEWFRDV